LMIADGSCCTGGHKFKNFAAPQSFVCAHCAQNVSAGSFFFGCMDCDRDLCTHCFEDPTTRNSKEPVAVDRGVRASKERSKSSASGSSSRKNSLEGTNRRNSLEANRRNSLEVLGPAVSTPPPQTALPSTVFSIPELMNFEDSAECEPGQHVFSHFPAVAVLVCNGCNLQIMPGTYIASCSECDTDLCSNCEASEMRSAPPRRAATAKKLAKVGQAKPTKSAGPPAAAIVTIPEQETVHLPRAAAAIVAAKPNISSVAEGGSPAPRQGRATPDSIPTPEPPPRRISGSKECKFCGRPYHGFGFTCGDCRKTGPTVHECRECQEFFTGFGDLCDLCRPPV